MGTDIHLYVERKVNGKWERVMPTPWTCEWCDGTGESTRGEQCYWCEGTRTVSTEYHGRNYDLFAMLAGVRNGTGFAGCDTGDGFVPIADPRGLPPDTSINDEDPDDEDDDDFVWLGDHSYSHITLAECLAYDYDRTTTHRGTVSAAEYTAWLNAGAKGPPESYSGGIMGNTIRTVNRAKMDQLLRTGAIDAANADEEHAAKDGYRYYTVVAWQKTYRESAGKAWFAFLEACRPLGKPEDVRFVFGFDS